MAKEMRFDAEARGALRRGFDQLADTVRVTLGPRGRSVVLDRRGGCPVVSNDGVAIAREIELADPFENMGAQLGREVSARTQEVCGDGTTTAVVLAQAMIAGGERLVAGGANPMAVRRGLERAAAEAAARITGSAARIAGPEDLRRVARVAAGDEIVGTLIGDALERVGRDGVVTVEEGRTLETTLDVVEGLRFDRGYLSPYFVTDPEAMVAILDRPLVLLCDGKIRALDEIVPVLERAAAAGRALLVVAEDIEGEALATLVVNRLRGTLRLAAVKAPGFGERRREHLEDLAALTGGTVMLGDAGRAAASAVLDDLGAAERVTVDRDSTTLVGGGGEAAARERRTAEIRRRLEAETSSTEREQLAARLGRLTGGVAVLRVGAATEAELHERKGRAEDALAATRAALEEGLVPGGGTALVRAEAAVRALSLAGDERLGAEVVAEALGEPLRRIAANAGAAGGVVLEEVRRRSGAEGFNAATLCCEDLVAAGVVDPARVVRVALQNAASIAGLVLTTQTLVAEVPDPPDGDA